MHTPERRDEEPSFSYEEYHLYLDDSLSSYKSYYPRTVAFLENAQPGGEIPFHRRIYIEYLRPEHKSQLALCILEDLFDAKEAEEILLNPTFIQQFIYGIQRNYCPIISDELIKICFEYLKDELEEIVFYVNEKKDTPITDNEN